jgi:hypothetical protein
MERPLLFFCGCGRCAGQVPADSARNQRHFLAGIAKTIHRLVTVGGCNTRILTRKFTHSKRFLQHLSAT